jgi:hypothetical protein
MSDLKVPVMFLKLCDKRSSGFVKDGTENTAFHEELDCPSIAWIPSRSKTAVTMEVNGVKTLIYKDIRWINGCNTIDPQEQDRMGIKPNPQEDLIIFDKGFKTLIKEGSTFSLYEYLEQSFFSKNNPNRPVSLDAIYEIMQLDKKAEEIDESDIEMADAIKLVGELRIKTGNKETPYKYDEDRINMMCKLCEVSGGDTPALKLHALMALAKSTPRTLLDLVVKFEQTLITEVAHALQLNVIRFDGNTASYEESGEVIKALGSGNLGQEKKIQSLADYFGSSDGTQALTIFRAKLEVAKQNALK